MVDLAALETPEGVASLPAPLHFQGEETDLLRALRRDGHRVMRCIALRPSKALGHGIRTF